ncbi:hypothetical protein CN286_31835, partial [Bacillus anthracis]
DRSCMYLYMIEQVPNYQDNSVIPMGAQEGMEFQNIIDVELADVKVTEVRNVSPSSGEVYYTYNYDYTDLPHLMMSPWVKCSFRNP